MAERPYVTVRRGRLALLLCAGVLGPTARLPAQQPPPLTSGQREWVGCWEIRMKDSLPPFRPRMLVRLDSMLVRPRAPDSLYLGRGLAGFAGPSGEALIAWVPKEDRDSVEILALGQGGLGWRLARSGDTLVGEAFEYYDMVPAPKARGAVSGRRERCPS